MDTLLTPRFSLAFTPDSHYIAVNERRQKRNGGIKDGKRTLYLVSEGQFKASR
jgi:hypothetical protein